MKYKVGDKVKIRNWKDMEKEYGLRDRSYSGEVVVNSFRPFYMNIEREIKGFKNDRTLTINRVCISRDEAVIEYGVKEFSYIIHDKWIVEQEEKLEPILNRFEILDLRGYS